jgi:2-dehydro-3-deoxyphosphogluconate aldolase/(4S)-4-hydroxy-2-oxoglutarate aldolase
MTHVTHPPAFQRLRQRGMLAVLRGNRPEQVNQAACVLIDSGVDVLEITFTVPGCADLIRSVRSARPDAVVGAGTVTTAAQLDEAVEAGADFIVTPGATPDLLAALAECARPYLPGVFTPSEVMLAKAAGAPGVKLFPGSLAGSQGLAALLGPFPDLLVVPTGGVNLGNVNEWLAAGAFAVGAGGDLAPVQAVDVGDFDLIRARAELWTSALATHTLKECSR